MFCSKTSKLRLNSASELEEPEFAELLAVHCLTLAHGQAHRYLGQSHQGKLKVHQHKTECWPRQLQRIVCEPLIGWYLGQSTA